MISTLVRFCTCPCGRCLGQVPGGHAGCPYGCGRSAAWLGQAETDRLEQAALDAYMRLRGAVPSADVPRPPLAGVDQHAAPGADSNSRPDGVELPVTPMAAKPRPVLSALLRWLRRRS